MRALDVGAAIAAAVALSACEKSKGAPASASPEPFEVTLIAKGSFTANQPGVAHVHVVAHDGFHVNPEYPAKFTFARDSNVTFAAASVPLLDVMEKTPCAEHAEETCEATAPISFTSGAAGPLKVAGVVALSVCNPEQCLIEKVPVELTAVAAASTP